MLMFPVQTDLVVLLAILFGLIVCLLCVCVCVFIGLLLLFLFLFFFLKACCKKVLDPVTFVKRALCLETYLSTCTTKALLVC
jgi:hypothetical protein